MRDLYPRRLCCSPAFSLARDRRRNELELAINQLAGFRSRSRAAEPLASNQAIKPSSCVLYSLSSPAARRSPSDSKRGAPRNVPANGEPARSDKPEAIAHLWMLALARSALESSNIDFKRLQEALSLSISLSTCDCDNVNRRTNSQPHRSSAIQLVAAGWRPLVSGASRAC